ncbi:carboxysome shell carbonic anhydrase [Thiohalophilus sp.]|uniref:carboxysome shell carbonic anhydrase n=1 Tax=Thiohalophilus sp. TaxID=3028392 RepID=UPI002ACEC519|nr:carboxysome shell carbonic anhydrase [Thiohalophilus sp.]MDZ7804830.1 carboxysome shell carbonic anhydrase [Thiohalophilus sp.]
MRMTPVPVKAGQHPLANASENAQLFDYEQRTKAAFDAVVPTLKQISGLQHEADFERRAQALAKEQLGFELPGDILADAWVTQLDMRRLFAWCVFQTYQRFCDDFFANDFLSRLETEFQTFLIECGFHTLDISPCADGRLAHVISYVLRLPHKAVRRKSYAGAMFDIEDSIEKWTETELQRFREGKPTTADMSTRYLKTVVYHFSSGDPEHEGCAAHGSDAGRAAQGGLEQLKAFQTAVENSFCCGASIDLMLIGLDTDSDAIRIHMPDRHGEIDLKRYLDAAELFDATLSMSRAQADEYIDGQVRQAGGEMSEGMQKLMAHLLINNLSQIEYVRQYHNGRYQDIGHAERFIGAGIGFEEVQLRNLTYFAYMQTVEEAAADLDVGIKIFSKLNVSHSLPVPVVVRFDYHGQVPGARERAIDHCRRVDAALSARYADLARTGLLHTLQVIRDCHAGERIEVIGTSVKDEVTEEAH